MIVPVLNEKIDEYLITDQLSIKNIIICGDVIFSSMEKGNYLISFDSSLSGAKSVTLEFYGSNFGNIEISNKTILIDELVVLIGGDIETVIYTLSIYNCFSFKKINIRFKNISQVNIAELKLFNSCFSELMLYAESIVSKKIDAISIKDIQGDINFHNQLIGKLVFKSSDNPDLLNEKIYFLRVFASHIYNISGDFDNVINRHIAFIKSEIEQISFSNTVFKGVLVLSLTSFNIEVKHNEYSFISCLFCSDVRFIMDKDLKDQFEIIDFDFHRSVFQCILKFENMRFLGLFSLYECEFIKFPPIFFKVEHNNQIRFPAIKNFLISKRFFAHSEYKSIQFASKIEVIYRGFFNFVKELGDKSLAGVAYVSTMRAHRKRNEKSILSNIISDLYDFVSLYGTNYARCFVVIFCFLIFSLSFIIVLNYFIYHKQFIFIINFFFMQLFQPFKVWLSNYSTFAKIIASLFSIIFYVLLWLFFLALRWSFKKD